MYTQKQKYVTAIVVSKLQLSTKTICLYIDNKYCMYPNANLLEHIHSHKVDLMTMFINLYFVLLFSITIVFDIFIFLCSLLFLQV